MQIFGESDGMTNNPGEVAADSQTKRKNHWNSIWLLAASTRLLPMQRPSFHKDAWSRVAVLGHNCQCYAEIWREWRHDPTFLGKCPWIYQQSLSQTCEYWQESFSFQRFPIKARLQWTTVVIVGKILPQYKKLVQIHPGPHISLDSRTGPLTLWFARSGFRNHPAPQWPNFGQGGVKPFIPTI